MMDTYTIFDLMDDIDRTAKRKAAEGKKGMDMYEGYNGGPLMNPLTRVQVEERDYCTCNVRHPGGLRVCAICGKAIYWMEPTMTVHNISCPDCDGNGSCAACKGSGMVVGVIGDQESAYTCGECDGDGFCSVCSGSGELDGGDDELPQTT